MQRGEDCGMLSGSLPVSRSNKGGGCWLTPPGFFGWLKGADTLLLAKEATCTV